MTRAKKIFFFGVTGVVAVASCLGSADHITFQTICLAIAGTGNALKALVTDWSKGLTS